MADITKCAGEGCDKKNLCYRYTAPHAGYWQSWFVKTPKENENCRYFWDNKNETGKQVP